MVGGACRVARYIKKKRMTKSRKTDSHPFFVSCSYVSEPSVRQLPVDNEARSGRAKGQKRPVLSFVITNRSYESAVSGFFVRPHNRSRGCSGGLAARTSGNWSFLAPP